MAGIGWAWEKRGRLSGLMVLREGQVVTSVAGVEKMTLAVFGGRRVRHCWIFSLSFGRSGRHAFFRDFPNSCAHVRDFSFPTGLFFGGAVF